MSPSSRALVPYRPRAPSATPSPSRKRTLGALSEMSRVSHKMVIGGRLTRGRCPRIRFLQNLSRFPGVGILLHHDSDTHRKPPRSSDREERLPLDLYPTSLWRTPTMARGSDDPVRLTTMVELGTSDPGSLVKAPTLPLSPLHHFPLFQQ
jgi:hypothetical protein